MLPLHYWQIHRKVWNREFDSLEKRFQARITDDQMSDEFEVFSAMVKAKTQAIFIDPEHILNDPYRWKVTPERRAYRSRRSR